MESLNIKGHVLMPSDAEYQLRKDRVYNKRFTQFCPEMICVPSNTADVIEIVRFASKNGKAIIVRCGGHSMTGLSACKEGEILVDMSLMNRVAFNKENEIAIIDGGCLLADVNFGLATHNKAIPVGDMGLVGISGLTLNGGFGALTNSFGLTLDHVEQVEIVTGQGEAITANSHTNSDVFTVIKQGCSAGRYLGVITSFSIKTCSVPSQVFGGIAKKKVQHVASEISSWVNYCVANPTNFVGCYLFGVEDATAEIVFNYMVMECEGPAKDSLKALLGESPKVDYYAEALNKLTPLLAEKECRMCSVEMLVPSWNDDTSHQIEEIWKAVVAHGFLRSKSIIFIHYAKPPNRSEMFWLQCIIGWDKESDDMQALAVAEKARIGVRNIMSKFSNINTGWQLDRQLVRQVKQKVDPLNVFPCLK